MPSTPVMTGPTAGSMTGRVGVVRQGGTVPGRVVRVVVAAAAGRIVLPWATAPEVRAGMARGLEVKVGAVDGVIIAGMTVVAGVIFKNAANPHCRCRRSISP
jgi:hypothetical protein